MKEIITNNTISDSKEESLKKAIEMLSNEGHFHIKRPNISLKKLLFRIFLVLLLEILFLIIGVCSILVGNTCIFIAMLLLLVFTIIVGTKALLINLVLLYQKTASETLRSACLFTPSCSEYMILALKKYGALRGFIKGLKRLLRCHSPNGGIDYP